MRGSSWACCRPAPSHARHAKKRSGRRETHMTQDTTTPTSAAAPSRPCRPPAAHATRAAPQRATNGCAPAPGTASSSDGSHGRMDLRRAVEYQEQQRTSKPAYHHASRGHALKLKRRRGRGDEPEVTVLMNEGVEAQSTYNRTNAPTAIVTTAVSTKLAESMRM